MIRLFLAVFFTMLLSSLPSARAAELAAFCSLRADSNVVEGQQIQTLMPIASVSKIMTTWWMVATRGTDYRFLTRIHLSQPEPGQFDVHLEGSRDPYFGKESLHFIISELNRRGITQVRRLSFDENFKFFWNVTSDVIAGGTYDLNSPDPQTVKAQLSRPLLQDYARTLTMARAKKIALVPQPRFAVQEISFVPKAEFHPETESILLMRSSPFSQIAKEMNRNSNNHAANQIFEHLGGTTVFTPFIQQRLGLTDQDLRFWNGSGDRLETSTGPHYNEASCSAVIQVLRALHQDLRKAGQELENVMALSGADRLSTTHKYYDDPLISNAMVAKTGTINPTIALAGLVHTQTGDHYFMFNVRTNGSSTDWPRARTLLKVHLLEWMKTLSGGKPVNYQAIQFLSFDN